MIRPVATTSSEAASVNPWTRPAEPTLRRETLAALQTLGAPGLRDSA